MNKKEYKEMKDLTLYLREVLDNGKEVNNMNKLYLSLERLQGITAKVIEQGDLALAKDMVGVLGDLIMQLSPPYHIKDYASLYCDVESYYDYVCLLIQGGIGNYLSFEDFCFKKNCGEFDEV